ncbi:hypothetical protein NDU88_002555, partial [Pleurodeles waltl]
SEQKTTLVRFLVGHLIRTSLRGSVPLEVHWFPVPVEVPSCTPCWLEVLGISVIVRSFFRSLKDYLICQRK